jgi:hypothetical protein
MSSSRPGTPGATRVCPHCKATVLETAAICPGCRHHLRFNSDAGQSGADEGYCALSVDGSIIHKSNTEPCEYFIVLDVRDERDQQVTRQVVGVGVLQPGEKRTLNVSVGMRPVQSQVASRTPVQRPASSSIQPAALGKAPPQPAPAVESRLQPRPLGKPPGASSIPGPGIRNLHKP